MSRVAKEDEVLRRISRATTDKEQPSTRRSLPSVRRARLCASIGLLMIIRHCPNSNEGKSPYGHLQCFAQTSTCHRYNLQNDSSEKLSIATWKTTTLAELSTGLLA